MELCIFKNQNANNLKKSDYWRFNLHVASLCPSSYITHFQNEYPIGFTYFSEELPSNRSMMNIT